MVQAATVELFPKELAFRAGDGVEVSLLWRPRTNRLTVCVVDTKGDDLFEVDVESRSALDAFEHPYAYAAASGVGFRAGAREAVCA